MGLIGSAISGGQTIEGVELAPAFLRSQKLIHCLRSHSELVFDFGDVCEDEDSKSPYRQLSEKCQRSSELFDFTFIVGGDHSQAIGSIHGLKKTHSNLKVIWVDAHGDINTPETSLSSNLHGMPIAALLGLFNYAKVFNEEWFSPVLKPIDIALLGVRDLDGAEREIIESLGIFCLSATESIEMGLEKSVELALKSMDYECGQPLHLSLDIDSLDARCFSATGLPVAKGYFPAHIQSIATHLNRKSSLISAELVEFNPLLANTPIQLREAQDVIFSLINSIIETESSYSYTFPGPIDLAHKLS